MKWSDDEGLTHLSTLRADARALSVAFAVVSADDELLVTLNIAVGVVLELDRTEARVVVGTADNAVALSLDLRGVTFVYGEPSEARRRRDSPAPFESELEGILELRSPRGWVCALRLPRL